MAVKVGYFQPVIMAIDDVSPLEFSRIYALSEDLHKHPELNDAGNPSISIRGGQQIQVYPNELELDVSWLVKYLESLCQGYMEIVSSQSGSEDLKYCQPEVNSIWTIRQNSGQYQEMHSHPGGNISGNIYITAPELDASSNKSDGQILFTFPQTKDITKFIMSDTMRYAPVPGTVIMFPSYLRHTVYPWHGHGHRTVMAFDAVLKPKNE